MDEITQLRQVRPEKSKTSFFCHFWQLKIHRIHTHSNICHGLNFHRNLIRFFQMLVTMSSITINNLCRDVGARAATLAIMRSYRRHRHGVYGDCGVDITPQMCNRVTNHGDTSTFSKPDPHQVHGHFTQP